MISEKNSGDQMNILMIGQCASISMCVVFPSYKLRQLLGTGIAFGDKPNVYL